MSRRSFWSRFAGSGYAVYRLFGDDGSLLYVGATKDVRARMYDHIANREWWPLVDRERTRVEWFSTVEDAADAEMVAISTERPVFNGSRIRYRLNPGTSARKTYSSDVVVGGSLSDMSRAIAETDAEIDVARAYRDELIRKAIADGATWVQVMEASGLSRRSVQLIVQRSR